MPTEIEHKYLIDSAAWGLVQPDSSVNIQQGYLLSVPEKTIRIRIAGNEGFITIKGKTIGASRPEYEYAIPVHEAEELLSLCDSIIHKTRHRISVDGMEWEVDEFHGLNAGLWIAEIELSSEIESYSKPPWLGMEVTHDPLYSNSSLAKRPYSTW